VRTAFADTSFYAALVNPRDPYHSVAKRAAREFRDETFTTEYVLIELGNGLARSGDRPLFLSLLATVRADPATTIIPSGHEVFERGVNLYAQRMDKDWSVTDCVSFVIMRERGIIEALTADHHFEQAGFRILLR